MDHWCFHFSSFTSWFSTLYWHLLSLFFYFINYWVTCIKLYVHESCLFINHKSTELPTQSKKKKDIRISFRTLLLFNRTQKSFHCRHLFTDKDDHSNRWGQWPNQFEGCKDNSNDWFFTAANVMDDVFASHTNTGISIMIEVRPGIDPAVSCNVSFSLFSLCLTY